MSMAEKFRRNKPNKREGSRARSLFRKYAMKKSAAVINHIDYERHHGFESTKHKGGRSLPEGSA